MPGNGFNVMDMLDDYADAHEMDPAEVFIKHPVSGNVRREAEAAAQHEPVEEKPKVEKPKKREWRPDVSVTEDMPELQGTGVVYDTKDIKFTEDTTLRNLDDDSAVEAAGTAMDDMDWKNKNIEHFKERHHILHLHIPEGEVQVRMLIAASDRNIPKAQEKMDEVYEEIKKLYPEMLEYDPNAPEEEKKVNSAPIADQNTFQQIPADGENQVARVPSETTTGGTETGDTMMPDTDDLKVVINKQDLPELTWTEEDVEKIRRSRTIELNIVEGDELEMGNIVDVDTTMLDTILQQYQRKTNDVVAALPASKYRATFTGLTYPEVMDLSNSNEMNNLDGERKKWSICFDHIKNASIGPWEAYWIYKDPTTKKDVKVRDVVEIPAEVPQEDQHYVSKFEDFLRKTSYMDLEYMLWKILCATALPEEVISIECNAKVNGHSCGNNYDWVYRPSDLLLVSSINPAVLEEIKETGEANSVEDIMRIYKTSPVHCNTYITLHTSGFKVAFGHISGYEYLNEIYAKVKELESVDENNDPTIVSKAMAYTMLTCIKAIYIPKGDVYQRITGADNLVAVINTLDEIDWQTLSEVMRMMIEPYQFQFSLRDIVCPKCHNKSDIPIDSMTRLLFIVARSLSNVQVTLKRN